MRINPDETYEQWAERVRTFELDQARAELAKGVPADEVLEWMGKRINQKMLHPIIVAIKDVPISYDLTENKKAYKEAYLDKNGPKSDHVSED
jgi:glutamyl-tRNA reductase